MANGQGIGFSQDFSLENVKIITGNGNDVNLRQLVTEFSYYEDLYGFITSGFVTIADSLGLIETYHLTGNEYIVIKFDKYLGAGGTSGVEKLFRAYKIGSRKPAGNMLTEYYTIYFCSEELLLSEQSKVVRVFKDKPISEMIATIAHLELRIPAKNLFIQPTLGLYDFVIPRMKPIEAISWLSNYARPQYNGGNTADMLFFETKEGFHFKSLSYMMRTGRSSVYGQYRYQALNAPRLTSQSELTTVLNYEVIKTHDMLSDIESGTFSNRTISIDPITRNFKVTDYDYEDYQKSLNRYDAMNFRRNKSFKTQKNAHEGKLKLVVSNADQEKVPFISGSDQTLGEDIKIEKFVPQRTLELEMANYNVLKITIPGDPNIQPGMVIRFSIPSLTNEKTEDGFFSGNYLVNAVRHVIIMPSTYQTILEIAKDSSIASHVSIDNDTVQNKSISGITDFYNNIRNLQTGFSTDADMQNGENFYGERVNDTYSDATGAFDQFGMADPPINADADIQGSEDFYGNNTYGESI